MALSLNIGNVGPVVLVQSGPVVVTTGLSPVATLPLPSTPGNTLILVIGTTTTGPPLPPAPPSLSWVQDGSAQAIEGTRTGINAFIYANHPGGLSAITFDGTFGGTSATWYCHLSEWKDLANLVAFDFFVTNSDGAATATATSGTTLPLTTAPDPITQVGDLAIAAWMQFIAVNTATFTTPTGGWVRLADNGATSLTEHLDLEYLINPGGGVPLAPTLTSNRTTISAAGFLMILRQAATFSPYENYLEHGSQTVKLNTYDFALIDPPTLPLLGDTVALSDPAWSGRIVSIAQSDIVNRSTGHKRVSISATNTATAGATIAPGDFSDNPTGGYFLLENGSGKILLEDGSGYLEQESTTYGYRNLSFKLSQNVDGTVSTYGSLETFETGYAPGQTIVVNSTNIPELDYNQYTITNVTEIFVGRTTPAYLIEFGSAYQTLQGAGGGVLTNQGSQANIQAGVAMPAGVLGYAQNTTGQSGITTETDITGLIVTVTVAAGRRLRLSGTINFFDTVNEQCVLHIKEGATQLKQFAWDTPNFNHQQGFQISTIVTPSAGTHTYKMTLGRNGSGSITIQASATDPAYFLVEDIGT